MAPNLTGFRPIKADQPDPTVSDEYWRSFKYPCLASPKLDGFRCVMLPGSGAVSNTLKPFPNHHVRQWMHAWCPPYLDGELTVGPSNHPHVCNTTQSGVMSFDGQPDFRFNVFDNFEAGQTCGFGVRLEDARRVIEDAKQRFLSANQGVWRIQFWEHQRIESYEELLQYEANVIAQGYEGVIVRSISGTYKYGRSTLKQAIMVKMKRFVDDEAIIVGWEPLLRNQNDPTIDALGLQKRGYSLANKVADDRFVGKFIAIGAPHSPRWAGIQFTIGSGLDDAARIEYRSILRQYNIEPMKTYSLDEVGVMPDDIPLGKMFTFKYQAHGSIDAPRAPIWKGFRDDITL